MLTMIEEDMVLIPHKGRVLSIKGVERDATSEDESVCGNLRPVPQALSRSRNKIYAKAEVNALFLCIHL